MSSRSWSPWRCRSGSDPRRSVTAQLIAKVTAGGGTHQADALRAWAQIRLESLTEREQEVAEAIGRGWGNAEIARRLYLGLPTVKAHVSRLLTKLDVANGTQVALLVHDARRPDHD